MEENHPFFTPIFIFPYNLIKGCIKAGESQVYPNRWEKVRKGSMNLKKPG